MTVHTLAQKKQDYTEILADNEDPFSTNKVTGWSINVPIIGTCTPTVVCSERCYFARGPATWSASLAKQHRVLNAIRDSPARVAAMIVSSARRKRLTFVRWNGGGDLVPEMLPCIDMVAVELPHVQQWVVSRKPALAAAITPRLNVWVHLSVDKSSWARLEEMETLAPEALQWHYSYQCDKGEVPPWNLAPVIFRDGYDLAGAAPLERDCPLNLRDSIVGVCESCRRCFNGEALAVRLARLTPPEGNDE
jgi:hypothetical protein